MSRSADPGLRWSAGLRTKRQHGVSGAFEEYPYASAASSCPSSRFISNEELHRKNWEGQGVDSGGLIG